MGRGAPIKAWLVWMPVAQANGGHASTQGAVRAEAGEAAARVGWLGSLA